MICWWMIMSVFTNKLTYKLFPIYLMSRSLKWYNKLLDAMYTDKRKLEPMN